MTIAEQRERLRDAAGAEVLVPVLRAALADTDPALKMRIESGDVGADAVLGRPALEALVAVLDAVAAGQQPTILPFKKSLSTSEAADLLGVSVPWVRQLADSGRLQGEKRGNRYRFRIEDVLACRDRRSADERSAVLAAFTESPEP